jgi:adenylate cyclase
MASRTAEQFSDSVLMRGLTGSIQLSKALQESFAESGHPQFANLAVGERASCDMVSVFLDLTDFTGRTFWDDADDAASLAHSVLTAFSDVVQKLGGHVLGLRGDGLYAGFGPTGNGSDVIAAAAALTACAASLDAIKSSLNPRLQYRDIAPLQARAGLDYGKTTFVRSGTASGSEVNVIGFAPNFAAKCEKRALSWEVVAGEGLHNLMGGGALFREHSKSPKTYQRDGERRTYKYFDVHWATLVSSVDSTIAEINGHPLGTLK